MSRFFRPFPERTRVARAVAASGGGDPPAAPEGFLVPAVPSGLETDTALPTLPSPWTSSTSGFYYVKQGGSAGDNGTPAAPRGTIPNPIPAGGVVVLDNTATFTGVSITLSFSGTSGSRCWFVSSGMVGYGTADARATLDYSSSVTISGDYGYLDGINFDGGTADGTGLSTIQNFLFRNCHFYGDGSQRGSNNAGVSFSGTATGDRLSDVVWYQCSVHDWGDWFPNTEMASDIDVHGVSFGRFIERLWFLESSFYHNQGDGIQMTGNSNPSTNAVDDVRNVYVQDCTFYENLQNGWWHKLGDSLVFARNTVYNMNYIDTASNDSAASVGCGGQYDFNNVWYLFNRFYDNDGAIQFASNNSGVAGQNIYIIGNVITNAKATVNVQSDSFSAGCGVAFWQGANCYVIGNTIHGFTGHGISTTNNSNMNLRAENNIISGRTSGTQQDIMMESYSTAPKIKNNAFPSSARFSLNGTQTTSVSAMQTADATNRVNNLSGSVSFVNAAASGLGDYHVTTGDATLDAGELITDVFATYLTNFGVDIKIDFEGTARPATAGDWDIGAYEGAA